MSSDPLVLQRATKRFTGFVAVDALDFRVPAGSIVGFLGPNGAGKSTSLRMALGIMTPDSGEARLFGERPHMDNLRRVGFLPEERGLYKKMSPVSTISYFAKLKGLSAADAHARAFALLEASGLQDFARSKIAKLSKGMAQKVQILATLAHEPELLILDEPFSGLDPVNQQALEELIRDQHHRGATIVFSTHVMEHAERLCDSIVMMARGKKVFDGTLDEAYGALGRRVHMGVGGGFDLAGALTPAGLSASRDPGDETGQWWYVTLPQGRDSQDVLRAALAAGAPITGFTPEEARLRDVFISLAGEADADAAGRPGARSTFAGAA